MDESESREDAAVDEDFAEAAAVGELPEPATANLTDATDFTELADALAKPQPCQ